MKLFKLFALIFFAVGVQAQEQIDNNMLQKFRTDFNADANTKALQNAISSNDIKKLAVNRENLGLVDTYFKYRVSTSGITDQKSSGRCWMFTGFNVMRPIAASNMNAREMKFSQSYLFFYDQLEKANLFLEGIINTREKPMDDKRVEWLFKNPIGDGGQWTGLVDLVSKYGMVPDDIMPESHNAENTSAMSRILATNLKANAVVLRAMSANKKNIDQIRKEKEKMLADVYRILALTLGEPPTNFKWRFETKDGNLTEWVDYTPKSFYDKWLNLDLKSYIMLMNDPTRPYYKLYEIDYDRHTLEGGNWKYINLPIDEIKKIALKSIQGNEAMYFSCDVGKQLDMSRGYLDVNNYDYASLFSVNLKMNKAQRIQTFTSGSTHGMTLVAADVDINGKTVKWLLENSWGMKGFKGHLVMTDQWFDEYMFRLVVNRKFVSEDVLKVLKTTAELLPPWDPMFSEEL